MNGRAIVLRGDAAHLPLPAASVDLIVTSPPYFGLRSYTDGGEHYGGQIGSEATPREYIAALLDCTREWVRVLKPSGSLFVNLGDKYAQPGKGERNMQGVGGTIVHKVGVTQANRSACDVSYDGIPGKCLMGLPWRYALGCVDDLGLILRAEIVWAKPNGLPESVTDRVRRSHEQVFHFTRQPRYFAAVDEVREATVRKERPWELEGRWPDRPREARAAGAAMEPDRVLRFNPLGKLPGSVWEIPSQPLTVPAALGVDHFAAFPCELPRRIILGWSPSGICTACGEGRRPVSDHERTFDGEAVGPGEGGIFGDVKRLSRNKGVGNWRFGTRTTITGYACACPDATAPARPAIVVDPFGGTGTTALVAAVHGRTGISVDRSADYCRLARWRVSDPAERARAMNVAKPPPVADGQEALFGLEVTG